MQTLHDDGGRVAAKRPQTGKAASMGAFKLRVWFQRLCTGGTSKIDYWLVIVDGIFKGVVGKDIVGPPVLRVR